MSDNYIEVEVSEGVANFAIRFIVTVAIVGAFLIVLSFIVDNMAFAVAGLFVLLGGILIYGIIVTIGSMKSEEAKFIAKMIAIILPTALGLTFGLVWISTA
ncbi:MAG: hypothetical protein ACXAD7_12925 [Candidatus Kariarchaeaceae archaeon]|jgi:hypothetical protein